MNAALANWPEVKIPAVVSLCSGCGEPFAWYAQLWKCAICRTKRVWGYLYPEDKKLTPLLNCDNCGIPQRHTFAGIGDRCI